MRALKMPPVRDAHGHAVWSVRVGNGEMTCTVCGEVVISRRCPRCHIDDEEEGEPNESSLVPTVSYLREDEFVLVQ